MRNLIKHSSLLFVVFEKGDFMLKPDAIKCIYDGKDVFLSQDL